MKQIILIWKRYETDNTDMEKEKEDNTKVVNGLLDTLQLEGTYEKIRRLGRRKDDKTKPLKISMTTLNEKQLIMSNLRKLKNATDTYRRISITDDYTFEERQEVRKKVIEAKNKTEAEGEGNYVWKVRGTPKNGQAREPHKERLNGNIFNTKGEESLKCFYSNIDQLLNKMEDMRMKIASNEPD